MTTRTTGVRVGQKDLLDVAAITKAEVESLLASAAHLKDKQRHGIPHPLLPGKTLGLLFQKPSTRTRVSFEAGMNQLGGHALVLPSGARMTTPVTDLTVPDRGTGCLGG